MGVKGQGWWGLPSGDDDDEAVCGLEGVDEGRARLVEARVHPQQQLVSVCVCVCVRARARAFVLARGRVMGVTSTHWFPTGTRATGTRACSSRQEVPVLPPSLSLPHARTHARARAFLEREKENDKK